MLLYYIINSYNKLLNKDLVFISWIEPGDGVHSFKQITLRDCILRFIIIRKFIFVTDSIIQGRTIRINFVTPFHELYLRRHPSF